MTVRNTVRRIGAVGATAAMLAGLGIVAPAAAAADVLEIGEVDSSDNVKLWASLPKTGAFVDAFNSDLAFQGDHAFSGNYNGFTVYDISKPKKPTELVQVVCPGSQNDVSVYGDLLFLSVDSRRTDDSCNSSTSLTLDQLRAGEYWEGIRIFDISNPAEPVYVKAVETDCGSHTHSILPSDDGETVYVYVSSYSPNAVLAKCQPPHDVVSIVQVPVDSPTDAFVAAEPNLFPDGGFPGAPGRSATSGCHDVTTYAELDLMAGACMGNGVVWDISDPLSPAEIDRVEDPNFAFWHSATFNNDGSTIVFTDELGGGGGATCNPTVGPERGANGIYEFDGAELTFASYYKISREQADTENCVAHNGSLIPVKGKDVMVQAWYQGGISVYDFTDPTNPVELGWFDRGALGETRVIGGSWSAYYYDGYIYSNDIALGFDVFSINGPGVATQQSGTFPDSVNVQAQTGY